MYQDAAWVAARDAGRAIAYAAIATMPPGGGGAVFEVSMSAAYNALWIVVQDLMPERGYPNGNPESPLIETYAKGLWPKGIAGDGFNIFVPPLKQAA